MIHHLSLPARNPRHVADVLAELFGGEVSRFGPYQDAYIAWMGDELGSAVEVFPLGTELLPGEAQGQARFRHNDQASAYSTTHATISIQRSTPEILAIAQREGWRALELSRGSFRVIEFWIENSVMLELTTPEMAREYIAATAMYRRRGAPRGE